jgi:hypothetical protein
MSQALLEGACIFTKSPPLFPPRPSEAFDLHNLDILSPINTALGITLYQQRFKQQVARTFVPSTSKKIFFCLWHYIFGSGCPVFLKQTCKLIFIERWSLKVSMGSERTGRVELTSFSLFKMVTRQYIGRMPKLYQYLHFRRAFNSLS